MWITAAEFLLIHADPSYVKLAALASPVTTNARKVLLCKWFPCAVDVYVFIAANVTIVRNYKGVVTRKKYRY